MTNPSFFDSDSERAVLGAVLIDNSCIEVLRPILIPDDFYEQTHRLLWTICLDLAHDKKPVDLITINEEARRRENDISPAYIAGLTSVTPSSANVEHYANIIKDKSIRRSVFSGVKGLMVELKEGTRSGLEVATDIEKVASDIANTAAPQGYVKIGTLIEPAVKRIERYKKTPGDLRGVTSGFNSIDRILMGIPKEESYVIISARASIGKAQPLNAKIKTVDNWKLMKDIVVGDKLASIDGNESIVQGVYPQGEKDIYKVTFSDGRTVECCDEHLWQIGRWDWDNDRVYATWKIKELLKAKRNRRRFYVPEISGSFGVDKDIIINPWLLGFLIGDGSLTGNTIAFTTSDTEVLDKVNSIVNPLMKVTKNGKYDYRIIWSKHKRIATPVFDAIKALGLFGTYCYNKFIPSNYLNASFDARIALLNGLISSDGDVSINGTIGYSTTSKRLANDVCELVYSLGGIASCKSRFTHFTYKGEYKTGAESYRINILLPLKYKDRVLFLPRHRERLRADRTKENRLSIMSIDFVRRDMAQCIMVSHPSHEYITDGYVPTHNTAIMMAMAEGMAIRDKIPVGIFSLEMSKDSLTDRSIANVSEIGANKIKSGWIKQSDVETICGAGVELYQAPIFISDVPGMRMSLIRAQARRMVYADKVKAIFIDHFSLIGTEPGNMKLPRWQERSIVSKELKNLNRELKIPIILLCQLGRGAEGKEPSLADLRETGSLEEDGDIIMFLNRERNQDLDAEVLETDLIIAKNRNGPTGRIKLDYFPKITKFKDKPT
jgi:replicative DNA helicase